MTWWFYLIIFVVVFKLYQILTLGICKCETKLTGKVVIVTGSNCGIGFETAKDLARRGARVILACRDHTRGKEAQDKIIAATGNNDVHYKHLDLASLASVRAFAKDILSTEKRLDVLINNAGVAGLRSKETEDGLIIEHQVNLFGPFLLTNLLLPALKSSAPSRIINLSSGLHWCGSTDLENLNKKPFMRSQIMDLFVYSNTKLWIILFTKELSRRLEGTGVVANSLTPGVAKSEIYRHVSVLVRWLSAFCNNLFFKDEWEAAQTSIHLAVSPECENISGEYYCDCKPDFVAPQANNLRNAKELWDILEKVVNYEYVNEY